MVSLPLGLPFANWASQECCLFYLKSSLRSSDLPLFYVCRLFLSLSFSHRHFGLLFPILTLTLAFPQLLSNHCGGGGICLGSSHSHLEARNRWWLWYFLISVWQGLVSFHSGLPLPLSHPLQIYGGTDIDRSYYIYKLQLLLVSLHKLFLRN